MTRRSSFGTFAHFSCSLLFLVVIAFISGGGRGVSAQKCTGKVIGINGTFDDCVKACQTYCSQIYGLQDHPISWECNIEQSATTYTESSTYTEVCHCCRAD
ncbi:hypothetical protein C5167_027411 [Papaver somniferum]|uniref:uncharacterized protein LOC113339980 n=1 Tax=Papaver somniferum TaxID=3469 RepID=UPI000E6FA9AB|nr:uncharacterized protein LOC113339980 [Papaver somniferum]RZC91350.1 hypothetical protein C5167_027411 [Papaver somniferum]